VVRWIFAQRLAGHSVARIARALNEAGIQCPSAADPKRNPHRPGTGWTLGTVTTILRNPRYTGHQVWNRQRTDKDLADPADISLGLKDVQRWNLPALPVLLTGAGGTPRSTRSAHRPALPCPPSTSCPAPWPADAAMAGVAVEARQCHRRQVAGHARPAG